MAKANSSTAILIRGSPQGELARELLDEQGPFLPFPEAADAPPQPARESTMGKLHPTVYSGPTIGDIETALAISNKGAVAEPGGGRGSPLPAVAVPEKGFNKMENKYTLRIKCCANGMADDGYKWRKYGQKSIKNSPNPRSYYRCTNPRCSAKKQVERSVEDPETLVVTYEGLHLHYAYAHFLLPRPRDFSTDSNPATLPPPVKRSKLEEAAAAPLQASTSESPPVAAGPATPTGLIAAQAPQRGGEVLEGGGRQEELVGEGDGRGGITRVQAGEDFTRRPQGLLEDIVPLLVRNPCSDASTLSSNPSFSSVPSSPPSTSSSSFTWPYSPTYFDLGVLSGTV